jgi:hypothetical protein
MEIAGELMFHAVLDSTAYDPARLFAQNGSDARSGMDEGTACQDSSFVEQMRLPRLRRLYPTLAAQWLVAF